MKYKKYAQPIIQKIDARYWKIVRPWRVMLSNGDIMIIGKGFVHDYTSVPGIVQPIFPKFSHGDIGAIAHDFMYSYGYYVNGEGEKVSVTRKQADYEMTFLMRVYGDSKLRSTLAYVAVRLFGQTRWKRVLRQFK